MNVYLGLKRDKYDSPCYHEVVTVDKLEAESWFIKTTMEEGPNYNVELEVWMDGKHYANAVIQYQWSILGSKVPHIIYDREGIEYGNV